MKDLDFDELDRAVNSLMSNVPKEEPAKDDDIKTVTLPSSGETTPHAEATSAPSPQPADMPKPTTPVTPPVPRASSVAARRSGRFMDVMHPSATTKKSEPAAKSVSRQGATVEPTSNLTAPTPPVKDTVSNDTPAPALSEVATPPAPTPQPITATSHQPQPKSDWPDPLDFQSGEQAQAVKPEETETTEPVKQSADPDLIAKQEDDTPLSSPFLPDAKVEKRPLGGAPASQEAPTIPITPQGKEDLTSHDPNDQLPASPSDIEPPLPEELQKDLVAIESGAHQTEESKTEPTEPAVPDSEPDTAIGEADEPADQKVSTPETASEKPDETPQKPTGPVSIPQQYKEEPSTGDKESGAIYDTDAYHQPLAHPAKKKSGWLLIVWIVLILVVGAGAGAALYFSGII